MYIFSKTNLARAQIHSGGSALGSKTRECEASSLLLAIAACSGHNYSDELQLVDGVNFSGS